MSFLCSLTGSHIRKHYSWYLFIKMLNSDHFLKEPHHTDFSPISCKKHYSTLEMETFKTAYSYLPIG